VHPVKGFLAVVLCAQLLPRPVRAQFRADSTWKDIRYIGGDIWGVWTAPAHATAVQATSFAAFAGTISAAAAMDKPVYHWIVAHQNTAIIKLLHPLRESASYPAYMVGTGAYVIPISSGLYLAGVMSKSRGLREAGMGCLAADLTTAGVRQIIFLLVQRDRPVLSPDDPFRFRFPGTQDVRHQSFFSGHIANSMGCATFLSHRFDLHAGEPVLYTFVLAIGAGRMVDGQHWFSDTVMGALFGSMVGRTLAARFAHRDEKHVPLAAPLAIKLSWTF
jgi:membrane-associated phospholipid phosphatase